MLNNRKVDFGSLEPTQADAVKPIDIYATLEKLEHYITYPKRYGAVKRKAVMFPASYLQNHYDLSVILKSQESLSPPSVKAVLSELGASQGRLS